MITTSRGEPDEVVVNSGVQDGYTTGTPIGMVIQNKDARSGKYEPYVTAPRPSHGDYTYSAKFGTRNWGRRRTLLRPGDGELGRGRRGRRAGARRLRVRRGDQSARQPDRRRRGRRRELRADPGTQRGERRAVCRPRGGRRDAGADRTVSGGGRLHRWLHLLRVPRRPARARRPALRRLPSRLGQALFAIPATTGVEFGLGKGAVDVSGSERNEDWTFDDGESFDHVESEEGDPVPVGNDHGGLQGGITTGEPIYGEATWHAPTSIPKAALRRLGDGRGEGRAGRRPTRPRPPAAGRPRRRGDVVLYRPRLHAARRSDQAPIASTPTRVSTTPTTTRAVRTTSSGRASLSTTRHLAHASAIPRRSRPYTPRATASVASAPIGITASHPDVVPTPNRIATPTETHRLAAAASVRSPPVTRRSSRPSATPPSRWPPRAGGTRSRAATPGSRPGAPRTAGAGRGSTPRRGSRRRSPDWTHSRIPRGSQP